VFIFVTPEILLAKRINFIRITFQDNAVSASNSSTTCSAADLESIKQEILREMKTEMNKMKQEIIEGSFIKSLLSRHLYFPVY